MSSEISYIEKTREALVFLREHYKGSKATATDEDVPRSLDAAGANTPEGVCVGGFWFRRGTNWYNQVVLMKMDGSWMNILTLSET